MQPHRDTQMLRSNRTLPLDFSVAPPAEGAARRFGEQTHESSCLMIDATLKWGYPPTSLPKREFMDQAIRLWKREELPALNLPSLYWGYTLGHWQAEDDQDAALAVQGEYLKTGAKQAQSRRKPE
jgi:4-hydroxy-3-polyprenylbenzoate decarboxylase